MKCKKIDFIILGGGCSALSLAERIVSNRIKKYSFVILEKRKKYFDDRSWCFWEKNKNQFSKIIEKNWTHFSFSLLNKRNILTSKKYKYSYVRSINFYNFVLNKIYQAPNIELKLNENILKVNKLEDYYEIHTEKKVYFARYVLDTRPNLSNFLKKPFMYQSFLGYEMTFKSKALFKDNNAYLMHNMKSSNSNFYFEYILPLTKNKILLEITIFSKKKQSAQLLNKKLIKIVQQYKLTNQKIHRKEYGVIPMGFIDSKKINKNKNYFHTGASAGSVRPSSGYAFLRIQKWAEDCALSIKKTGNLVTYNDNNYILKKLDKIFLEVISNNTVYCPIIFYRFSKNILADTFIRFMNGNASYLDYIKVIYAMPKRIFLKCLLKSLF